ncbi:MAG: hypothetical protein MJZ26_08995 [Fibrobacter sp.]|nr:hypothetical protein [Fibrobacter sp.]
MNRYTIYCTKEQTIKALELGAPIIKHEGVTTVGAPNGYYLNDNVLTKIPTSEQMLGWLEEQDDIEEITILRNRAFHSWAYLVTNKRDKLVSSNNIYQSRHEATIAAIDAALEYLIKQKDE